MRKVLWLASWYPNETEPFSGDFIKRQAEAVSNFQPIKIIYAGKYLPAIHNSQISKHASENLQEFILYYSSSGSGRGMISKIRSLYNYFRKHAEIIQWLRDKNELPDLVHVQVAMKAGLVALYLKWKYKIPYVLTEHWSGYYKQAKDSLFRKSFLDKYLTRRILKNADRLLPVSEALGKQISHYWAQVPFQKIPNVVNTRLFYPAENKIPHPFRFIHISNLLYPKNPEGIIITFIHLLRSGYDAELILVGPLNPSVNNLLNDEIMSTGKIRITGEVSYEQVGRELRDADALVIFSLYENMPCVMLEALCTGIPVIAPRVGGIPEVIHSENGILVEAGKEIQLFDAMKSMIVHYDAFDKDIICRLASEKYSYETIGKEIIRVYDSVLNEK
jgi:glycosyltransferase involved in cell wall biosynthesis